MTRWVARLRRAFVPLCAVLALCAVPALSADGPDQKAPDPKRTGTVYEWKTKDGVEAFAAVNEKVAKF